jgi:Rrf2 family iron-sulfur cluster assembly transcriptional regulator
MKLGTKGRYAVTAMVDLACHQKESPVCLSDIAMRQNLSLSYLEQLFLRLKKADLVYSIRGQKGGYLLSRSPCLIKVSEILIAADESLQATACNPHSTKGCQGTKERCLTHNLWSGLSSHILLYLQSIRLSDICERKVLPSGKVLMHDSDEPAIAC